MRSISDGATRQPSIERESRGRSDRSSTERTARSRANIAEGYSRSSGADRARFFEYSLGSGREAAVWYRAGVPILGRAVVETRTEVLSQIRRILLTAIPFERIRRLNRMDGGSHERAVDASRGR